jgi:hypothetical protein
MKIIFKLFTTIALLLPACSYAQVTNDPASIQKTIAKANADLAGPNTKTDLFFMLGSDFDRPGLTPRANYNIGIGHTFDMLNTDSYKNPLGDELTFSYTYENGGSKGFWHENQGVHTEALGIMRNFAPRTTPHIKYYTWLQSGVSEISGGHSSLQNRLFTGVSVGAIIPFSYHNSVWTQYQYNKVVTTPWYTTFSTGYTYSF